MPAPAILNIEQLDPTKLAFTREQIYERLPQAHEFKQLDGIIVLDTANAVAAAVRNVRADEWWCRAHLPGRPIFPGILMLESAAHLAAFYYEMAMPTQEHFMGFGGLDKTKFRQAVYPGSQIIIVGKCVEQRSRRFIVDTQAYVAGTLVFEATITGMPVKR